MSLLKVLREEILQRNAEASPVALAAVGESKRMACLRGQDTAADGRFN
jgi:hypothetical protein